MDGEVTRDDESLRDAARAWLRATDRLDAAMSAGDDEYGAAIELAEEASLARMRFERVLTELGWSPPARTAGEVRQPGAKLPPA